MLQDLKSYSSIGNREGILLLCRKTLTGNTENLSSIKSACSFVNGVELNFKCGLLSFKTLGLIKEEGNTCTSTSLIYDEFNQETFIKSLCFHCIKLLLENDLIDCSKLKFSEDINLYVMPMNAFSLKAAVFRNLLISLSALTVYKNKIIISKTYESAFIKEIKHRKITTQEELLNQIEKQQIMGQAGEEFVLNFEKNRCPFSNAQKEQIKQISLVDTSAGYDIISFHSCGDMHRRYIEVKTFSGKEHFNWSENEINSAKLRGENYYIYLVDYNLISSPEYTPVMIQNPYKVIIELGSWSLKPTSFLVSKK